VNLCTPDACVNTLQVQGGLATRRTEVAALKEKHTAVGFRAPPAVTASAACALTNAAGTSRSWPVRARARRPRGGADAVGDPARVDKAGALRG
jgi:hypothetical protein